MSRSSPRACMGDSFLWWCGGAGLAIVGVLQGQAVSPLPVAVVVRLGTRRSGRDQADLANSLGPVGKGDEPGRRDEPDLDLRGLVGPEQPELAEAGLRVAALDDELLRQRV